MLKKNTSVGLAFCSAKSKVLTFYAFPNDLALFFGAAYLQNQKSSIAGRVAFAGHRRIPIPLPPQFACASPLAIFAKYLKINALR
jgi:hypothetical protein